MANTNLAGGESFPIYPGIERATRFVDVTRFREGELALPEASSLGLIEIWSGPSQCSDWRQFSPKFEDGKQVVLKVHGGQSFTLPRAFFSGHAVALVGDVAGSVTLRLRG